MSSTLTKIATDRVSSTLTKIATDRVDDKRPGRTKETPKAFAKASPGLLQPWVAIYVQRRNAESVRERDPC